MAHSNALWTKYFDALVEMGIDQARAEALALSAVEQHLAAKANDARQIEGIKE